MCFVCWQFLYFEPRSELTSITPTHMAEPPGLHTRKLSMRLIMIKRGPMWVRDSNTIGFARIAILTGFLHSNSVDLKESHESHLCCLKVSHGINGIMVQFLGSAMPSCSLTVSWRTLENIVISAPNNWKICKYYSTLKRGPTCDYFIQATSNHAIEVKECYS